jgi:hypothetical protein
MKLPMISFLSFLFSSSLVLGETSVHAFTVNSIQGEAVDLYPVQGEGAADCEYRL